MKSFSTCKFILLFKNNAIALFLFCTLFSTTSFAGYEQLFRLATEGRGSEHIFLNTSWGKQTLQVVLGREIQTIHRSHVLEMLNKLKNNSELGEFSLRLERGLEKIERGLNAQNQGTKALTTEERFLIERVLINASKNGGLASLLKELPKSYQARGLIKTTTQSYSSSKNTFLAGAESTTTTTRLNVLTQAEVRSAQSTLTQKYSYTELQQAVSDLAQEFGVDIQKIMRTHGVDETTARLMQEADIWGRLAKAQKSLEEVVARGRGEFIPRNGKEKFLERLAWGLKDRQLANNDILKRIANMVAIEMFMTTVAEYTSRGERFWDEFDEFTADLITFTLCEIVLGWSTAGRMSAKMSMRGKNPLPATIWSRGNYTKRQRFQTFVNTGKLLIVTGFGLGLVGNGVVEFGMKKYDEENKPSNLERLQKVVWKAALVGIFMSGFPPATPISSNFRYMGISHLQQWVVKKGFVTQSMYRQIFYTGTNLMNNFFGGFIYVKYDDAMDAAKDWAFDHYNELFKNTANEVGLEVKPVPPGLESEVDQFQNDLLDIEQELYPTSPAY